MALKFAEDSVNLSEVGFLVADPSDLYRELFRRLLFGFGAKTVHEATNAQTAARLLTDREVDFMICAVDLAGPANKDRRASNGLDFVRAIRLDTKHPRRAIPMVITMGTARRISVGQARDCGANFVLSKPVAPVVLYDRINWIARKPRPFWDSATYFGPDRRFREDERGGTPKRRQGDTESTDGDLEADDAE
ncbi:response regulator [Devosia sp. XJ19-1]|uniref:Response regulator n=1 Tax=Devosia ureilytica TaxID=2952754 RepID=A0A9Q4FT43_9HYPH|nr:response regulator [Devosia ureilytica]MCP8883861.1 response regulator [Devosia ureilytica]MCP8887469.1 response regulator [Devosia ureilytica]